LFTYKDDIGLPLAVWLAASSDYDLASSKKIISGTSLQKPIKSIILSNRVQEAPVEVDILELVSSKLGTAVHDAVERAWLFKAQEALKALGYSDKLINRIVINPVFEKEYPTDAIFVHIEKRTNKEVYGYTISGKFDLVFDGELYDIKTTQTYNYISGSNVNNYIKQGSIYKWLNPNIITSDILNINYLFTDWKPYEAERSKDYPQTRVLVKQYPLMSIEETEEYIKNKVNLVDMYIDADQKDIPECPLEELWPEETKWAYYKNPNNLKRATKLFTSELEANQKKMMDNSSGVVIKRPGQVKRCHYCAAKPICLQAEQLKEQGLLK